MSESHEKDVEQMSMNHTHRGDQSSSEEKEMLDARIVRALQERAALVQFSPALRVEVMQRISPARRSARSRRILIPALSTAAALALILVLVVSLAVLNHPVPPVSITSLSFVTDRVFNTPAQLAQGGQIVSLDPTRQHLVYRVADQEGVMYVTNLADPVAHNELAMRFARGVAWAPDGSALVTTIYPVDTNVPLLALVPTGQYMHLLGEPALAASWLPSSASTITYITEANGQAMLWEIMPDGKNAHSVGSMAMPMLVQRLSWSPASRFLAILATPGKNPSRSLLQGPSHTIYMFDTRTRALLELVAPGNYTLGSIAWSPAGHLLTYEQIDAQQHVTLHTIDVAAQKTIFTVSLQLDLLGMSWSPDNRALLYSDGGVLHAHVLHGQQLDFSSVQSVAAYPFWLDNQHILFLSIQHGVGQLARLAEKTAK